MTDVNNQNPCFLCSRDGCGLCSSCSRVWTCSAHETVHRKTDAAGVCSPFRIVKREEKGRIVVATRDIKPGELVLTDTPLAAGPGSKSPPCCLNCLAPWLGKFRCSSCGWPVCDSQCEKGDNHLLECGVLQSHALTNPTLTENEEEGHHIFAGILPLRLAVLEKSHSEGQTLQFLMDHRSELEANGSFANNWVRSIQYFSRLADIKEEDFKRGIGLILTNAVAMPHRNGKWLFPIFSFLSHSCSPNARFTLHSGEKVFVRAQAPIREGEEVTISYLDTKQDKFLRREYLERKWNFFCQCELCSDSTEKGTYFSAIKCRDCQEGFMLGVDAEGKNTISKCSSCPKTKDAKTVKHLTRTLLQQVNDAQDDQLQELISKFETVLHPNNFILHQLKNRLVRNMRTDTIGALEQSIQLLSHIMKIESVLEPGLSIALGENLRLLNSKTLELAKMRLKEGEIDQKMFLKTVSKAAANVKLATKCFEDFSE